MKRDLLKKQIPTLFALVILFIGAAVGILLVGRGTEFLPRAGPEFNPKNILLSNITDRSFTVSWTTDAATTGFIRYGTTSSLGTTATDDRDQLSGETGSFKTHHVTIRGLSPDTQYFFKIGSGPSSTMFDDGGSPYTITTGTTLSVPPEAETAYGTVYTASQTPAEGSVVYVKLPNSAPLSTLVKSSGSWAVPLSTIRTTTLDNYLTYDPQSAVITIEVISSIDGLKTLGTTLTGNDQPVPNITLGQNFDYTTSDPNPTPLDPTNTTNPTNQFDTTGADQTDSTPTEVTLTNPSVDGETINTTLPEISGSAPPGATLEITLESPITYQDQVVVDETGEFSWTPPEDIEPGEHTLTIKYLVDGVEKVLTRTFTVYAQGESDLPSFTSSPSGTPITSPTPTPTPTPIPSTTPTPTPTPTSTPTSTASPSSIPVAGSTSPTILIFLLGIGFITTGIFLSRHKPN